MSKQKIDRPVYSTMDTSRVSFVEHNHAGRPLCTGCGMSLRKSEIAFFETSSVPGATVEQPRTPGSAHGGVGPAGQVGEVLCEYCYATRYGATDHDGTYDFSDYSETIDPWDTTRWGE